MTPTPHPKDVKGTQPEQLVEHWLDFSSGPPFEQRLVRAGDLHLLATAFSECRERERTAYEALRDIAYPDNWPDLKEYPSALDTWMQGVAASTLTALAAQPPSEASERSGT